MEIPNTDELPIACDLTALDAEVRSAHIEMARQLLNEGAQEVRELPDGGAFRYTAEQYAQVTQFIANERLCCPFFTFVLEVTPRNGPIWLRITGREGVKDFLQTSFETI
jgi:hypothetical protein